MIPSRLTRILQEARRRRVFGVLALYIVGAWVILQAADLAFPGWHVPESAIRFVWTGAILLLPLAIVFGWYYDITAQGVQRTPAIADAASTPLNRFDFIVLSLLTIVVAGVGVGIVVKVLDSRSIDATWVAEREIPPNSIAVLPFVNMSDDESNEYFSDGISEQLLNELSRVPDLHVAARTSAFYYKGKNEAMHKMGRELGVRTILEGSVRKSGNTVRITAQLINASDGYHLWSHTYDRELEEVFAVQDEIARAITATLQIEMFLDEQERLDRGGTDNTEAYDAYLRGMAYQRIRNPDSVDVAADLFRQALESDPKFALALDALAYTYLLKSFDGSMMIDAAIDHAQPLIAQALEIEPNLEQAHATLGFLKSRTGSYDEANGHFRDALRINPNYFGGQVNFGLSLVHQSRLKEASAAYLRALTLDPLNANLNFNLGALMMLMGQFDDGYDFMQKSLSIEPDRRLVKGAMTHWLGQYGRLAEAVHFGRATHKAHPDFAMNTAALTHAYTLLGLVDEASALLDEAAQIMPEDPTIEYAGVDFALSTGDFESFIATYEEEFQRLDRRIGDPLTFDERWRVREYGWGLLLQDRNEEAAEILYWSMGGEEGLEAMTYDYMIVAKLLALGYKRLDRDREADILLNRCLALAARARDNGWATPVMHVRLAEIHAQNGQIDDAIEQLTIAVDKGFRDLGRIEYGIFWQHLQDHPDLNRLKVRMYEDIEAQRDDLQQREQKVASGNQFVTGR